jgi:maltose-binding protein MalE
MVASKGYSINVHVPKEKLPLVIELIDFLTSPEAQLKDAAALGILPSNQQAYADSSLAADATLAASQRAIEMGRRMPVVPEMRILWDVMRPELQAVMNGAESPQDAAKKMQQNAEQQIAGMRQ